MQKHSSKDDVSRQLQEDPDQTIEKLFREYFVYLCRVAYKIIPDPAVVEDLAQDVFLELWRRRSTIQFNTSVRAYLRRAVLNKAMNYLRDQKPHLFEEPAEEYKSIRPDITQEIAARELQERLDQAIDQLPERCRIIFILSRFDDMTYKEISQMLDISVKTVENQIGKALKLLRQALGPLGLLLFLSSFF